MMDSLQSSSTKPDSQPKTYECNSPRRIFRTLIVDDDPQLVRLFTLQLQQAGFEVTSAADGKSALRHARTDKPDIILLDVTLPDSSGIEISVRLRSLTSAPIILITGHAEITFQDQLRAHYADDYLIKPVNSQELLAMINSHLPSA
ncbi:MAG: response regulator [Anaerolineae bacterium]|nr:response regulator [Anaerolineae bacterium]